MIKKSVLIVLADNNFNEVEYLTIKNGFQRADIQFFIASDSENLCIGNNGIRVKPDIKFFNIRPNNFCGIIISGGSGIRNYWTNASLIDIVKKFNVSQKIVASICSAPVILAKAGLLKAVESTCFPGDRKELEKEGAIYIDRPVVQSKNILTAQSQSAAADFVNIFINNIID
ncbi:MAG: DJ-1/PfpI family protein [Bacteroidetes bacterium]|nr:DJ-1/PfpI family protein [Bacteroidota bacterium]